MAKANGGGRAKTNYPQTRSQMDACNRKSHIPMGPKIPPQTEAGREKLVASHRKIHNDGMIAGPAKSSGSVDLPYDTPSYTDRDGDDDY